MISNPQELDVQEPGVEYTVESAEEDLQFLGTHSATGRLKVVFIQGEEAVGLEVVNPALREKILALLTDAITENLNRVRTQEADQA